jgi:hypothetical protein
MLPVCVSCGVTVDLVRCTHDECPNLLCPAHSRRHFGRCNDCWETPKDVSATMAERLGQEVDDRLRGNGEVDR